MINQKLHIKTKLINPYYRSTIYSFKEYKERNFTLKDNITLLEFLWFVEQKDNPIISDNFSTEENEKLYVRIVYQCTRYNIIENIHQYLNKQKKNNKKTKYYKFVNEMDLKDFKVNNISYAKLMTYEYFHKCLDFCYIELNHRFRNYYIDYLLLNKNKQKLNEAKELNKVIDEKTIVQKKCFELVILNEYKALFPEFILKDQNKINFISLLKARLDDKLEIYNFLPEYCEKYPLFFKDGDNHSINLIKQTKHYHEQIAIYMSFILQLIALHPDLPLKDMCHNTLKHDVYYDVDENDENNSFYATIKTSPFVPILIDIKKESITLQDINRYIALLTQMESYFFTLLEAMFIMILHNDNNVNTKDG